MNLFLLANNTFREKKYEKAVNIYNEILRKNNYPFKDLIRFNRDMALVKLGVLKINEITNKLEKPVNLEEYYYNLIEEGGFFDSNWYKSKYEKKYGVIGNPLSHYLEYGLELKTNPSTSFDTAYYLKVNTDVNESGVHPFLHYVCQGYKENRQTKPVGNNFSHAIYQIENTKYLPRLDPENKIEKTAVDVIAFYLPQFHVIKENNLWWGDGFTEWTNVNPAKPLFEGHYQPHIPDDFLGQYDLTDVKVMHKQIELAKQYGIDGFCFYAYWFTGHRLLEKPLENLLNDKSINFSYCICWANENWSRRWDGLDEDLLIVQHYSESDDIAFIEHMSKYLHDPRYIKVNQKPLLIIYRPNLFPNMSETANRWRNWCRNNGLGEIYLAYVQSFESKDPSEYGLDAAIEFPPNNSSPPEITNQIKQISNEFKGKVYDWRVYLSRSEQYECIAYPIYRTVCPSWDNTARKKERGTVFENTSPNLFRRLLENTFQETINHQFESDKKLVFINAWNEWAEGAHLEPDKRNGYAWLQAIRDAHKNTLFPKRKIIVIGHDAYPHGAQLLLLNILKYLKLELDYEIESIILGKGPLLQKYAEFATVRQIELDEYEEEILIQLFRSLNKQGFKSAFVNTTVSGEVIPYLKEAEINTISLIHEMPELLSSYGLHQQALSIANECDHIVFAAKQVKDGFEKFIGHNLNNYIIRPQGLYLKSFLRCGEDKEKYRLMVRKNLGIPSDSKIIMCAGYADYRKGFDLFVDICINLIKDNPNIYALWVGHGNQSLISNIFNQFSIQKYIRNFIFTGHVEEPQPYYLASDVFALTSREDPFPSVVLESLDALTPVVAFKGCGGFEDLLIRGCGKLVPKENTIEFSIQLKNILDDGELSKKLAKCGQDIVKHELSFHHYIFDLLSYVSQGIPSVSTIVPNYNYANYLKERLDSVINQTLPIYELVVLDDQSTDNSIQVIDEYFRRINIPSFLNINKFNSGSVFAQWKKGLELSRGEYIWIAEADDTCHPEFLNQIICQMQKHNAVLGFSDSWQLDEFGNHIGCSYKEYVNQENFHYFDDSFSMNGEEFLDKFLSIKNVILNVSSVVFKRQVLLDALNQIGDEIYSYKVAGDWRIYIEICRSKHSKICYESTPLNGHRRHQNSVTHALSAKKHLQEIQQIHYISNKMLCSEKNLHNQFLYLQHIKNYLNI